MVYDGNVQIHDLLISAVMAKSNNFHFSIECTLDTRYAVFYYDTIGRIYPHHFGYVEMKIRFRLPFLNFIGTKYMLLLKK